MRGCGFVDGDMVGAILIGGADEVAEERVGLERLGLEFRVELAAEKERVRWGSRRFRRRWLSGVVPVRRRPPPTRTASYSRLNS